MASLTEKPDMSQKRSIAGHFALILVLLFGFSRPAAAEFFGCNDTRGKVLYSSTQSYPVGSHRHSSWNHRHTDEFAARPARTDHRNSRATNYHSRCYYDQHW